MIQATATTGTATRRLASIDALRGGVMVLMALDHVRVYLTEARFPPTDLDRTTLGYFLTRWVTHFCAPLFVFLAGTAAYLHGRRSDPRTLARYLWTRGAWLIVLEMTVIRLGWTFNADYGRYLLGGVIWMIGWCMIALAAFVRLPAAAAGGIGLAIVFGHNLLDGHTATVGGWMQAAGAGWLWRIVYAGGPVPLGADGPVLAVLFSIVPWVGLMAAGYGFGAIVSLPPGRRDRWCAALGITATLLFVALRWSNLYGDPSPWSRQPSGAFTLLSFLNTTKYPGSLLFVLMTVGPALALVPALERAHTRALAPLVTFGRTPLFYYLLHIPLIHAVAVAVSLAQYGEAVPWLFLNHPMGVTQPPPDGWGFGLPGVYAITALVVAGLYFPCRWMEARRARGSCSATSGAAPRAAS
jgi:uncharacterized membrane protein